jgi:hypothetical protein
MGICRGYQTFVLELITPYPDFFAEIPSTMKMKHGDVVSILSGKEFRQDNKVI